MLSFIACTIFSFSGFDSEVNVISKKSKTNDDEEDFIKKWPDLAAAPTPPAAPTPRPPTTTSGTPQLYQEVPGPSSADAAGHADAEVSNNIFWDPPNFIKSDMQKASIYRFCSLKTYL